MVHRMARRLRTLVSILSVGTESQCCAQEREPISHQHGEDRMPYSIHIFRAENDPALAKSLINKYRNSLAQNGIFHVMSLDISPEDPNLYFVTARTAAGCHIGAMGVYICRSNGGPLEDAFCAIDSKISPQFRAKAKAGLANLCLGFVDPRHRHAGLYAHVIRVVVAMLPSMGVRHIAAVGSKKGIQYYGKFGMLVDNSVGNNGEVSYPPGFSSNIGWADLLDPPKSCADELLRIDEIKRILHVKHPRKPKQRRHTSMLSARAQDLKYARQ